MNSRLNTDSSACVPRLRGRSHLARPVMFGIGAALWLLGAMNAAAQSGAVEIGSVIEFKPATPKVRETLTRIASVRELVAQDFRFATVDLNGDGNKEMLVMAASVAFCGSDGCALVVLEQRGKKVATLLRQNVPSSLAVTKEKVGAYLALVALDAKGAIALADKPGAPVHGKPMVYPMLGARLPPKASGDTAEVVDQQAKPPAESPANVGRSTVAEGSAPSTEGLPTPDRVIASISGPTPLDTAARRASALAIAQRTLVDLTIRNPEARRQLTPAETALQKSYWRANADIEIAMRKTFDPACRGDSCDQIRYAKLRDNFERSDAFQKFVWERVADATWRERNVSGWQRIAAVREEIPTAAALAAHASGARVAQQPGMAFPSTGPAQQVPPRMPPRGDPNVVPPTEITGFNIGQYRFRLGESKYDEVRSLLVRPVSGRGPAWADAQPAPWLPRGRVIEWNGPASDGFGVSFDNMKLVFDESQTLIAHFVTMGTGDLVSLSNIFQMRQAALEQRYTLMGATPRDWSQVGEMTITPEVPRGISFRGPGVFGTLAPTPQRLLIESFVTVEMAQRAGLAKAPLPPTPNASPQGANPLLGSWVLAGEAGPLCDRIKDIRFEPERIVRSNFGDQMVRYIPVGNLLWRVDPLSANDFFRWSFEVLAPDRLRLVELDCEFVRRR